ALASAVELSHRYIPARQLPDKAISLLDTACARVAVSQHAIPAGVEDQMRRRQALEVELGIIGREAAIGIDTAERAGRVETDMAETDARLAEARERWEREKALVAEILGLRARLRGEAVDPDAGTELATEEGTEEAAAEVGGARPLEVAAAGAPVAPAADPEQPAPAEPIEGRSAATEADREELLEILRARTADLAALQGETPLVLPSVDRNAVAAVAQDWTGIPVGRMLTDQAEKALALASILAERVVGQDHAMQMIAERVQTSRAGLDAPNKPVGVFLLVGPSGVGKTETALALAESLYGGEQNLISINMSEFQEPHTVSTLKGAPPGYKGYGKGGVLTEAVRRRPYSVILLDEVEKAHSDVHEIFFQVFDKGIMDDSEGRRIDFKNTLILLTSNVGSDEIMRMTGSGRERADPNGIAAALRPALLRVFPAAFLGRVITIPYYPLSDAMIDAIARLQLERVARRLRQAHGAVLHVDDSVYGLIRARCTEVESGGRMIDAILTGTLLPELSRGVLNRAIAGERLGEVRVGAGDGAFTYDFG
ncbi:MAG TPA: AAA family ATPase, partial [Thermohalobaculum sp.]|nr:AAA family ATPase [Thermohalobaculum sp.]